MVKCHIPKYSRVIFVGLFISVLGLALAVSVATAKGDAQTSYLDNPTVQKEPTPIPMESVEANDCVDCHPDKKNAWMDSPHAHSADNSVFLKGWENMERSTDCLLCHQATYNQESGEYQASGISCETCHGVVAADHPPAEVPARSDEEYCGTCHPATLGEARLSGHSTENEVRCVSCLDPHSQKVLFENPNDMCKDCYTDDLEKMDQTLSKIHLQKDISCADCHMLDVPHTFVFNFQHEDTTQFFTGFDCTSEISVSVTKRVGTEHEVLGSYVQDQMNWPIAHRVSQLESAPQCADCHVMNEELRSDFIAIGYTSEEVDELSWESQDFPALTDDELNKLVAKPKRNWSWIYWLLAVVGVFEIFEFAFTRKLKSHPQSNEKPDLLLFFRRRFARRKNENGNDQNNEDSHHEQEK